MVILKFDKQNKTYKLPEGIELKDACKIDPSIPLKFGCQQGDCGTCKMRVLSGMDKLSPKTKKEKETLSKLKDCDPDKDRLACQCAILGDVTVSL